MKTYEAFGTRQRMYCEYEFYTFCQVSLNVLSKVQNSDFWYTKHILNSKALRSGHNGCIYARCTAIQYFGRSSEWVNN